MAGQQAHKNNCVIAQLLRAVEIQCIVVMNKRKPISFVTSQCTPVQCTHGRKHVFDRDWSIGVNLNKKRGGQNAGPARGPIEVNAFTVKKWGGSSLCGLYGLKRRSVSSISLRDLQMMGTNTNMLWLGLHITSSIVVSEKTLAFCAKATEKSIVTAPFQPM
jgi:hypothetical protein